MPVIHVHAFISGHVQGVFYRSSTQRQASALGLRGWVRNLPDGRVEAVFEGEQTVVERMLAWCRQGPPNAYVTGVETHNEPLQGQFTSFAVYY